jgi:small subunit ribosomal protein S16
VAVRIRLKRLGRKHRPYFRICAMDSRTPRDGRVLEELGTYDPMVPETDARTLLKRERVDYWLGVGAKPTEKVAVLIKKYGSGGTHVDAQRMALDRLAQPAPIPDPGEPASLPKSKEEKEAAAPAAAIGADAEAQQKGEEQSAAPDQAAAAEEQPA